MHGPGRIVATAMAILALSACDPKKGGDKAPPRATDAPEIDGHVYLRDVAATLKAGDIVDLVVEDADEHDLFGVIAG